MNLLGEFLFDVQSGFACGTEDPNGVFQFRMNNISKESQLVLHQRRRVPWDAHTSLDRYLLQPGDVLFNSTNSPDGVGKSILMPNLTEDSVFSNHFIRLRTDPTRLDSSYLWRWLQWLHGRDVFSAMCKRWVNQATVSRSDLLSLPIDLPDLAEQRRIAAILDQADALRAKRSRILSLVGHARRALFVATFGNPLSSTANSPRVSIGSVADVVTGNTPSRANLANFGDTVEWIKSDNLGGDNPTVAIEWLSRKGAASSRVVPKDSVLVTCIAGSRLSIGKASIADRAVAFNQQINAVLPSPFLNPRFLLTQLKVAPELVRAKSTGGMKGLVSKSSFLSIEILCPSISDQDRFGAQEQKISAQQENAQLAADRTQELFASLQARAFRGEL